nr:hypothetical protein [Candidatus Enterousia merdequi]
MKQSENKKSYYIFSIIGMIGVLLIGGVIGFTLNNFSNNSIHSTMTKKDCDKITEQIINAGYNNKTELIEELNEVYSENCKNRIFEEPKTIEEPKPEEKNLPETTCGKIEMLLLERLNPLEYQDSYAHIDNAKIYANLSERGCPENSEKFKELAKQELEIARALTDDKMESESEATEMVETYKRLQLQVEAERMIEKAKKLTNPAIDFIIQLEKIIEE